MASIEVMNVKQTNPEAPIEIQLSTSNITYRGPKGDQGPAGPAGRDGAVGYDGKSAYELAVDNGFEGTEVEWLASLKGETGATGPAGAQGPAGQNGTTPVKGTDYFTQQDIADIVAQVPATDIKFLVSSGSGNSTGTSSTLLSGLSAADKTYLLNAYNNQLKNTRYFVIQDTSGALFYPLTTYSMRLVFLGGVNFQNYYYLKFDDTPASATTIQKWDKEDVIPNWGVIKAGSTATDPFNSSANTSVADAFSYINTNFATKSYVENIVRAAQTGMLKRQVVQALPQSNDDYTIYMVPKTGSTGDVYNEFLYMDNTWELIGNTQVDLTNYALKSEIPDITGKQDILVFANDDYDASDNPAATIGDVNSLDESIGTRIDNLTVDDIKYDDEDDGEGNLSPITLGAKLSDIDTAISNIPSGSSYTAGDGISIDANNVISSHSMDNYTPILMSLIGFNPMNYTGIDYAMCGEVYSGSSIADFINVLKSGKLVYVSSAPNWNGLGTALIAAGYQYYVQMPASSGNRAFSIWNLSLSNMTNWRPSAFWIYWSYQNVLFGLTLNDGTTTIADKIVYTNSSSNLVSTTMKTAIDELAGKLPTPSTTDGTYKLTSTITSGSPAYSWEADSGSGGASYTAGDGINIDANNTISFLDKRTSLVPIIYSIITRNSGMARQDISIQALWNNRFSRANLTYHIDNLKTWRMTYFSDGLTVATWRSLVEALEGSVENLNTPVSYRYPATSQADQYTYIMAQGSAPLADNSRFNMANQPVLVEYIPDATVKWIFISYPERLFQNVYFNSQQGLTSHSMAAAIDEVAIRIPAAPTIDGTYTLQCVVSSGTPTYSWVSAS